MNLLLGCDAMGYKPLREAVAAYLSTSRGVHCAPEQVAIVSGVQEALDLVARLLNPGDRVCMENPGYPGVAAVFKAAGAKVSAVPLDGEGMTLQKEALRGRGWSTSRRGISFRGNHDEPRAAFAVTGLGCKVGCGDS